MHPLSLKNGARPKRAQAMIFERMSIHNKIVVQEQNNVSANFGGSEFPKISTLDKSIILSYLIISFTTKSLILAQDER